MVEYAAIISVLAGASLTDLISFEPTWNVFFRSVAPSSFWVTSFSNIKKNHSMMRVG